jgi:hypothetical protein
VLFTANLQVFNGTGAPLTNVTASGPAITTTGTASVRVSSGPQPRSLDLLSENKSARFKWQGTAEGRGLGFLHVGIEATCPNGDPISAVIECSTLVIPPRP